MKKKLIIGLVLILVVIQLIRIDKNVPDIQPNEGIVAVLNPSNEVKEILNKACMDCHSYQTHYPWYGEIAPVSWWLKDHINDGRKHLNFDIWAQYPLERQAHKLEELVEEIEKGEMPLNTYTWLHTNAQLSANEREALVSWAKTAMAQITVEE